MSNSWEFMLAADDLPPPASPDRSFHAEDYDELHCNEEAETDYYEFLSSTRQLPSAQWGLQSSRDPSQIPEWD